MLCFRPITDENVKIIRQKEKLPLIVEKQKVGSGSYNIVYNAVAKNTCGKQSGNKYIFRRSKDAVESMKLFKQEIKMAVRMANLKAGPEIYKVGLDKNEKSFILMEHYPSSLRKAIEETKGKRPRWKEIEKELKKAIYKMAEGGIFCSDLKFRNVVARRETSAAAAAAKWEMKLIDFGEDFCSFSENIYLPQKNVKNFISKNKNKVNLTDLLYCSMMIMMSINSERTRTRFYRNDKPLFSSEIKSMPLDVKISALLLIGKGDSKTGMRKPISQARHYYPKPLPNTDKIYEILTGETLKK